MTGRLRVVGTPIGNLEDLTPRAADALRGAALIACEDTRRTGTLAAHAGARGRLLAVHAHNEAARADAVIAALRAGDDVALVTDAGMPSVSDPGARLVGAVAAAGLPVDVVPGPSAVTAAVAVAGAPADRFAFGGFVPRKDGDRGRWLDALDGAGATVVAFESPNRLPATLAWLVARDPARPVAVCRELTKLHEEVTRGPAARVAERYDAPARGEITLVLWPAAAREDDTTPRAVDALVRAGLGPGQVADAVAALGLGSRNDAYRAALAHPSRVDA
ncbi:MAG: 16S rRNA (cytidine(1402)-2'-O)-methyltransferase [Thermoleophilia bacterium]|nr:16S rRNA (cytidine(1402)-2'-O)-methyltransferase [Thermoleophilia bacterium]